MEDLWHQYGLCPFYSTSIKYEFLLACENKCEIIPQFNPERWTPEMIFVSAQSGSLLQWNWIVCPKQGDLQHQTGLDTWWWCHGDVIYQEGNCVVTFLITAAHLGHRLVWPDPQSFTETDPDGEMYFKVKTKMKKRNRDRN